MNKRSNGHRDCGHSVCGQNFIDTGSRRCIRGELAAIRFELGSYVEHNGQPANVAEVDQAAGGSVVIQLQTGRKVVVDADELHVPE